MKKGFTYTIVVLSTLFLLASCSLNGRSQGAPNFKGQPPQMHSGSGIQTPPDGNDGQMERPSQMSTESQ